MGEPKPRKYCRNPRCDKGWNGKRKLIPDHARKHRAEGANLYCSKDCFEAYPPRMHQFLIEARILVDDDTYTFELAISDVLAASGNLRCSSRVIGIDARTLSAWLVKWDIDPRKYFPIMKHPHSTWPWSKMTDREKKLVYGRSNYGSHIPPKAGKE